jgi:hypothetical protein
MISEARLGAASQEGMGYVKSLIKSSVFSSGDSRPSRDRQLVRIFMDACVFPYGAALCHNLRWWLARL